jgi:hypothetical protein
VLSTAISSRAKDFSFLQSVQTGSGSKPTGKEHVELIFFSPHTLSFCSKENVFPVLPSWRIFSRVRKCLSVV